MYSVFSKLKEAMRGSSRDNRINKRETVGADENCKDEKPKNELEELLVQCSQLEDMDSQDLFSDSPILFSSQKSGDKQKDEESDEDSDCYEIVDKTISEKDAKASRNTKNNGRLRLTRKRPISEQLGQDSHATSDNKSCKQRRVVKEDDLLSSVALTDNNEEPCGNLTRVYRYPNCVCRTVEEADSNGLFFAPKHVNPALYKAVIVRKLESYRRRLRRAQSCLMSFHPHAAKGIDPVSVRSRIRLGARVKRTSVVKKTTQENRKQTENQRVVHVADAIDVCETPQTNDEKQTKSNHVATKISPKKESQSAETSSKTQAETQTDVVTSTNEIVMEFVNNDESNATPVKPVLHKKRRKAILEEASSDDDLEKFELKPPVLPKETENEEADCVVVTPIEDSSSTVAKEPSQEQQVEGFECPMCYKKFSKDRIEQHAFLCDGVEEVITSTNTARTVDIQDGQMSPVIKTRTPTKVKELKLLKKIAQNSKPKETGVESKEVKRHSTGGILTEVKNKPSKRISLEPSIRLQHIGITGVKYGQSGTKGQQLDKKDNEKNESTPRQSKNQTLQKWRLSASNIRKNLDSRSWDVSSLKKDFIPLEFENENKKIPSKDVHKLLSLTDTNSSESSSDEKDDITKIPVASRKKSIEADDDMSALSVWATDYKGRKRRNANNVKGSLKKAKASKNEENATEHCFLCGKDVPRSEYAEHVDEDILRQQKEDEEKECSLSMMACMSQNTDSDGSKVDERKATLDSRLSLPDLAEGTTRPTNDASESPLKTFTPLQQGSNYHKQFSFLNDKGQSSGNRGTGRGQRDRARFKVRRKR